MSDRMLVIDDENVVLESCNKIFTAEGFDVVTTNSAQEGLDLIADSSFDVVLCDWKMPGFDGMDVVEEVDKRSPDSVIVMISGYPSVGRATEAMKRGALDYVPKPFSPDEIAQAVKKALRRKLTQERKTLTKFEKLVKNITFPLPSVEDIAPQNIAETVAQSVGVKKVTSPWLSVIVLGVLAGAYIGFGGLLSTSVTFDMAKNFGIGFSKVIGGSVFSVGLMLVVIAGAELFTGNNLMVTSILSKEISFGTMINRWIVVYVTNFAGSIILALIFFFSGLWKTGGGALGEAALNIAYSKVSLGFVEALVRAIGCNWLVCLAVWMALASKQIIGKIFAIYFPIMAFVAIGFEHCVANMYFIPAGILLRAWGGVDVQGALNPDILGWGSFFVRNLIPVTIGNLIGGGLFVSMSYWGAYLKPANR
jgi:formate/nitrite transporter